MAPIPLVAVAKLYSVMLMRKAKGWFTGYNSNVEGHEEGNIRYVVFNGGSPKYMATIKEVADSGYDGMTLTPGEPGSPAQADAAE